ncbi:MAG TPA: nucleotide exchange factor GrpE [Actinophytocola sp.]|uniref:nucleotide exchange factor GrpE n=1 Tax=Actinophytocola sp. TaxID=1872138 RepID=UPI002DDCADD5|nr:nucleotide exchange factor GrpE [Actinophytocola sp.]HEV2781166.1 nucleotide exchange factor GrpE [Actinophytocola sp.]
MENEPGITTLLDDIKKELTGLHEQSRFLNEVVDRLHAENERLRRAEAQGAVQPALRELIKLADDWRSRAVAVAENPDLARLCGEVVEDVTMILERQGIEQFHAEPGAEFDRHQQRAVGTQPTDDEALDGIVAQARRPGYVSDGRVVRFAEVVVFKFAAPVG